MDFQPMTKKARLREHLQTLNKIGTLMTALRNLSLIEMNKVAKSLTTQENMHAMMQQVGHDFLTSYPQFYAELLLDKSDIYILIGSERGFCGCFNDNLIHFLEHNNSDQSVFIIVGHKLAAKLAHDKRVIHAIEGPNTMEEIPDIILNLLNTLDLVFSKTSLKPGSWTLVFNKKNNNTVETTLQQPFSEFATTAAPVFSTAPQLTLSKEVFMLEYVNQYLFSMLYTLFYQSFVAENYCRSNQLQSASERLEKKINQLTRNINLLRQEEITQEIQIIMLSADLILEESGANPKNYPTAK